MLVDDARGSISPWSVVLVSAKGVKGRELFAIELLNVRIDWREIIVENMENAAPVFEQTCNWSESIECEP